MKFNSQALKMIACGSALAVVGTFSQAFAGETVAVTSKEVKVVEPVESPYTINFSAAYDSSYMFRGVNVLDGATGGGSLLSADVNFQAYGFTLGAWYAQSISESIGSESYNELDIYLSYTYDFGPVALTGGYTYYLFPKSNLLFADRDTDTHELNIGISTNVIPFVTPSLFFYYDMDLFEGGYLEFKLASSIPVIADKLSIDPYALVSYDFEYNSADSALNHFQAGVTVPFHVTPNVTISGYCAVSVALDACNDIGVDDYEVYGGAKVGFSF